jgi:hypothetical protein
MDEHFVPYLLNTLDPVTRARVEVYLRHHPDARERLSHLQILLSALAEDAADPEPPADLVVNTLAFVAQRAPSRIAGESVSGPRCRHDLDTTPKRYFRPADWIVAAVLLLLSCGVLLPLLARQWHLQQRAACSNNLRKFWVALSAYADRGSGEFPAVTTTGPRSIAGIFVPMLTDVGLAQDVSILCPANGHAPPMNITVAGVERLYASQPEFDALAHRLSGQYAYSLGYEENRTHFGLHRHSGDTLPIMADSSPDEDNSRNHGSPNGQNVLFVGGNVVWCRTPTAGVDRDNIYINHRQQVHAGVCRTDSVLGRSGAKASTKD